MGKTTAKKLIPLLQMGTCAAGDGISCGGTRSQADGGHVCLDGVCPAMVMDDWGQGKAGHFAALHAQVDSGKPSEKTLRAELGPIVTGVKPGRESDDETNLFWHRGLSLSDIALSVTMLEKARAMQPRPEAALSLTGSRF